MGSRWTLLGVISLVGVVGSLILPFVVEELDNRNSAEDSTSVEQDAPQEERGMEIVGTRQEVEIQQPGEEESGDGVELLEGTLQ